jgi:hypothetical protein
MKEWKNNPESDDECKTDEKINWSLQEKLKSNQYRINVLDVNDTSDEKEKQVGRAIKTSRKGLVEWLKCLPRKCALSSNPSTKKKKKNK